MYQLLVYDPGARAPRAKATAGSAAAVLELIPQLLAEHEGCEHVVVLMDGARLFSVNCAGERAP